MMRTARLPVLSILVTLLLAACSLFPRETDVIERGRYLVTISGCNDCHTEGFMDHDGEVPEREWLAGSRRGWRNEQGTVYATNLRLFLSQITETQWLLLVRTMRTKSPMAWYQLQEVTDNDLRAIYRYIRHLGPAGVPAPLPLPPDVIPPEPYIDFPTVH